MFTLVSSRSLLLEYILKLIKIFYTASRWKSVCMQAHHLLDADERAFGDFRGECEWQTPCDWTSASIFMDLKGKMWLGSTLTFCFVGCCNQQLYRWCTGTLSFEIISRGERYFSLPLDPHADLHAFLWLWISWISLIWQYFNFVLNCVLYAFVIIPLIQNVLLA